ncbi:MAG TPA: hypothetical protein VJ697_16515 [Nitrososphaeraceae archaeon]|nr:hypothetical protein [Nitrososphaeraceae archaeon]
MHKLIIKRLEDIGKCKILVSELLDDEIFDDTSKHNTFWHSENEKDADKLDDVRRKLMFIHERLCDMYCTLNYDYEDQNE